MGGPRVSRDLRLVLFGDGAWAASALRRLHRGPHRILGVFLRHEPSDASLSDAAAACGIPVHQPPAVNATVVIEDLRRLEPDLGLSVAYNQIFRRALLEVPRLGILNFHAGLLPFYRGRNVINWAILNGERELGMTAHYVDEGIDTGDIVLQRHLPIGWTDTYGDVLSRAVESMPDLVEDAVRLVAEDTVVRCPQPEVGTYFAGRGEGDEWLDWSETAVNLHNKVRAITRPGPGARTSVDGEMVVVWRAFCDPAWPKYQATPGQVVGRRQDGILVKTGDSVLLVQEVQFPSKASTRPSWPIGTRLGAGPRSGQTSAPAELVTHERWLP